MAFASHIDIRAQGAVTKRLSDFIVALRDRAARRRIYVTTRNELQSLSDRDLNDLGIRRSQITQIAHEAAYQE